MTFPPPGAIRPRGRRRLQVAVLLAVLVGVLILSALLWPGQRTGALRVPTSERAASAAGVLSGTLQATRRGDRVCYVVRSGGIASPIVLPQGWGADRQLDLLDPTGYAVAQDGDRVDATGSPGPTGSAPGCAERGRVWTVSTVRTA